MVKMDLHKILLCGAEINPDKSRCVQLPYGYKVPKPQMNQEWCPHEEEFVVSL